MDKIKIVRKYLIINPGSASRKYALYAGEEKMFQIHFEKENGNNIVTTETQEGTEVLKLNKKDYSQSLNYVLKLLLSKNIINKSSEISAIGMRIVAPGEYFLANRIINGRYLSELKDARERAPLHLLPVFDELEQIRKVLPKIKIAGISDSAFNAKMPDTARLYGLSKDIAKKFGVYRFGYHGISAQSILPKISTMVGFIPPRVIICHLGSGSSVIAIKDGKCFDTSMGFTPLEGPPMGTRVGNIDAGAVIYLLRKSGMSPSELLSYLNTKCGLLGISGETSDVRELIELEKSGDKQAKQALANFVYQIKKYIGSYVAVLGGIDLLVFTATIGERSSIMRNKICAGLEGLGVVLDEKKDTSLNGKDGFIQSKSSTAKIAMISTDEMREMAHKTAKLC